jgi:hypothetical protein
MSENKGRKVKAPKRQAKAPGIGTEHESSLHRTLKVRYVGKKGRTEVLTGGYVCDGITKDRDLIEVQTGSFGPLKRKIAELTASSGAKRGFGRIRIIHPVIVHKYIELYDNEGALLRRRKSPRKGSSWDLFKALLYAPELPLLPDLSIELVLLDVLEKRIQDGRGSWRRKGASIHDREILEYHQTIPLLELKDYYQFIPFEKNAEFTVRDLGAQAHIDGAIARKALYVLTRLGIVRRVGKQGNAWVYTKAFVIKR